ncbi:MAG: iron chelate uptake ABC transporter family permease subunit [Planctomycetota bacterium]|nr:iron ABC transporter permease [Planctomycetota bacterium]MCX8039891.1 iron ABC transporter permease [Planctomycetota bacterium]MDW8373473.1 iron chelate uptake ABC transporter family permease subunit [Planctomycetota bacterium]
MAARASVVYAVLLPAALGAAALSLAIGSGGWTAEAGILALRGWRSAAAALAGAALAVAGVLAQALFRNPLASPDVIGTSAGATLGGQLALVAHAAGSALLPVALPPELLLPLGCLGGAAAALAVLLTCVAASGGGALTILLTGFIITAIVGAGSGLLTTLAAGHWELARALAGFGYGSVAGKGPLHLALALPLVVAGVTAAWWWSRTADLLLCGDEEAAAMGVRVGAARFWLLAWTALLTAAAVVAAGPLAFVGLIVPHALRPYVGCEHRQLVPAAALGGALFLLLADLVARCFPLLAAACGLGGTSELPLAVVTALVGGPLFLVLFARARREGLL